MDHPYSSAEDRAFWSRAVTPGLDLGSLSDGPSVTFGPDDVFMSAGSCFASNVRRYLESWGHRYTVTEAPHPQWPESREALYYEAFSARYGNVYTARQMVQLLERALGTFRPQEEFWVDSDGTLIDPFRPGLAHRALSPVEFRALTAQHLEAVRAAVEASTVFVFTLGLTEAWCSADDGAVFPACPGTVSGTFDPERHRFVNFTVDEVADDLARLSELLASINPTIRIVLTVSPVPLVATASGRHVLVATTASKSVLRVAADIAARSDPRLDYFPAYEIVTGPQSGGIAFEDDLRNVREDMVATVMSSFAAIYLGTAPPDRSPGVRAAPASADALVARALDDECEEMMADDRLRPDRPAAPGPDAGVGRGEGSGGLLRRLTGRRHGTGR